MRCRWRPVGAGANLGGVLAMKIISLFSGIGGLELGLEAAIPNAETIIQVEQNEFCRQVLAKHWPNAKRYSDVREVDGAKLPPAEILAAGFPCQDISSAGKGAGLAGTRSGLWYECARIIEEARPRWVVVENVASGAKRWVDAVRGSLGQLGYETIPIPISAADVGAPHLRRRVFIVAHANGKHLRHKRQRDAGRRTDGVCPPRQTEPAHDGAARHVAHANGGRRESERKPPEAGQQSSPRSEPDGRSCTQARPSHPRRAHEGWAPGPPVCGVDDGPTTRMDRDRLKALGNAVVPQCAQVVGEIINLLRKDTA